MDRNNFDKHVYLKGRGIKYAVLVDSKSNLKIIPYNFDYLTFLFGGLAYLFRKEILKGIALLFVQVLSVYILSVPIGIILSFIITFIVGIFSGKAYTNKLIKEGALSFDEYEENGYSHEYKENIALSRSDEKKGSRMSQSYKQSMKKQNTVFYCVGILMLVCITLLTGFKVKFNSDNTEYKAVTTQNSNDSTTQNSNDEDKKVEIPNEFIIILTDDKNIESFALIKFDKDKHKMNGKYYNGKVLVKQGDTAIPLNEIFKDKEIIPEEVFEKYFGIDKKIDQIKIDIKKAEEIMPELKDSKIEDKYKDILINTTKLGDEKYENIVKDASILKKVDEKVEEDYLDYDVALKYKSIVKDSKETFEIKKGKYYEISLNSIVSNKAIKALGDTVKGNVLYYFDYNDLHYNSLVKKLKAKDKEIKEAEEQEEAANNVTQSNTNNGTQNNSGYNNYRPTRPTRPQGGGSNNSTVTGNGGSGSSGTSGNTGNSEGGTVEEDNNGSGESNTDNGNEGNNQNQDNGNEATQGTRVHHRR